MTSRFTIDARGAVKPDASETAAELATRSGQYVLLPTVVDMLCALRAPLQGGRASSPRAVLVGDASGFPLSDLIAFLSQSRWSGVLRVHTGGGERSVALKDGEVRGASSEDPADRLSEVLVRLGLASRSHVDEALREVPPSKVGRALVDKGVLQAHQLWAAVSQQVSDIFHTMVLAREGVFFLVDQDVDERLQSNVQLSTQSLLMDAIRKIDELAHFRGRIPHGRMYVTKKRPSDGKLHPDEDLLLGLATGRRTVLELAAAAHLSEFEATKVLFRLLEGGYASVSEVSAAEAPPVAARAGGPGSRGGARPSMRFMPRCWRRWPGRAGARTSCRPPTLPGWASPSPPPPCWPGCTSARTAGCRSAPCFEAFARERGSLGSEPVASLRAALSDVDVLPPLSGRRVARVPRRRGPRPPGEGTPRRLGGVKAVDGTSGPRPADAAWPRLTAELPGTGGRLKQTAEDFRVEEVPAFAPTGTGDHLWLWVQKRGRDTAEVARALAKLAGVDVEAGGLRRAEGPPGGDVPGLHRPLARRAPPG